MTHATHHDAIDALRLSGYAEREAAFLYLVAVHSGYFLRRQFCEFTGRERGSIATHFLRRAITHGLVRSLDTEGRNRVYHLSGKSLYHMLGDPDSQNRRVKSSGEILRRLMTLDVVLRHLAAEEFLETESAKRRYFVEAGSDGAAVAAALAFGESVPVSIPRHGEDHAPRFYFIDEGQRSLSKLERFLAAHKNLFRALPRAKLVYVASRPIHFESSERMLARLVARPNDAHPACPLGVEHLLHWLIVNRKFHGLHSPITPEEHRLLEEGVCLYRDPIHAGVIAAWNSGAMDAGKVREVFGAPATKIGFAAELIEASYPGFLTPVVGHRTGHEECERQMRIALPDNEIEESTGQGQTGQRAGTTPARGPAAAARSFPPSAE
ncbi:MAG: hypothetical protein ACLGXA_12090 [Acidobacteriota bacterium]